MPGAGKTGALQIAFVTGCSRAREFKLACAAGMSGHRVVLVSNEAQFKEQPLQYFESHHSPRDPWETLALLDDLGPDVIHLFVNYNNFDMLPVMQCASAPVVYDPYDCMRGMLNKRYQKDWIELRAERRCFELADHVCARNLEPRYLRRHFGYRMPGITYFPEYCWREPAGRERRRAEEDELHVVYCGGVWPEDRYSKKEFGYAQYIEVGRILAGQRIHLHVYPAVPPGVTDFEGFFSLYMEESTRNDRFHFHRPVSYHELVAHLRNFDAALHVLGSRVGSDPGRITENKLHYSTANKLFDYMEAGLPVVIHRGRHQVGIVRHYGTAVPVDSLRGIRPAILAALERKRERKSRCDLAFHAPRLSQMYQSVARARDRRR